jgi:siderophore synthetase component
MKADEVEVSFPERWQPAMERLFQAAIKASGKDELPFGVLEEDRILMPVHELQIPNFVSKFPSAYIYPPEVSLPGLGQQSVRGIQLEDPSILPNLSFKVAMGLKLTSALRTIFPYPAYSSPRICENVLPHLVYDREKVRVLREVASIHSKDSDPHISKHCAAYLREMPGDEARDEILIVSTALMEWGHGGSVPGTPAVVSALQLDSAEKKTEFFDR